MDFAGALRQAVQASGLTLERIRHRLGQRGLPVSVATLSYWQRGRSRPRSRAVVAALEEVLGVAAGTLTGPLDTTEPGAAGPGQAAPGRLERGRSPAELWPDPDLYAQVVGELDRSGEHRLERLSTHDVHLLGADRRPRGLAVRNVLRAAGDDVDRVVCVHPSGEGAELTTLRYCRPGRVRESGGLLAFELVFDRVLAAGDTAVIEYELRLPGGGPAADHYDRRFPRPVRDYLAIVQFHPETYPARCYGFSQETRHGRHERLDELWIGTSGSAHLAMADVRHGILGIEWEWD